MYRLPLLFGGLITEKQRQMQLIYQWMDYHKRGVAWWFNHSDKKKFGNSWLNTDIFTKWLAKKEFDNGYHEMNVSPGDFTYWELGKCFKEIFKENNTEHTEDNFLSMPESCFFIQNESELEPLSLYDEIEKHSIRHISGC